MTRLTSVAALAVLLLGHSALAQNSTTGYTVYTSFVFARTGERTSELTLANIIGTSVKLTPYGANQMYNMGSFFRNRYIGSGSSASHMILGLNPDIIDDLQITLVTPDTDFTTKSGLAFMQSFYPPYLGNSNSNQNDSNSQMANDTFLSFPMNGYQIPMIQTYDDTSPESIYVNGGENCINNEISSVSYYNSSRYIELYKLTLSLYEVISPLFYGTPYDTSYWSYINAANVYELLDYMNRHNTTVNRAFAKGGAYEGLLPVFSGLANEKLWSLYGNKSVSGSYSGDSILTVAGQTLAAFILQQLESNIYSRGIYNKFNIAVGDYQPMLSLISLLGLDNFAPNFRSLPPYGSALVFEVFSYSPNAPNIPDPSDLYVQVLFRNASDINSGNPNAPTADMQAYSMFGRGPSGTVMSWNDFQQEMSKISIDSLADWCTVCQGAPLFCIPFLRSSANSKRKGVSGAVGGVIGAFVVLAIGGLLFGLAVVFGGVRVHREQRKSPLRGFKGSAKLASDADLRLPDNAAAPAGAVVAGTKGHERVGSWELKSPEEKDLGPAGHQRFASLGSTVVGRPSFEADHNDISEELHSTPTRARESF